MDISYKSVEELVTLANNRGHKISDVVLMDQATAMECSHDELLEEMSAQFQVMKEAVLKGLEEGITSTSGLTGGDAYLMRKSRENGHTISGNFLSGAIMRAISVAEVNASMGRIVAAPTAGSCGIVPSAVITMQEECGLSDDECVRALLTASGIGMVISNLASVSGAEGGCQAECGSASAMAAAAIVELAGGSPTACGEAVAIALKNILGLVCDPVAGLVEIPCIKRNASGVTNAITSAEMALAGIGSHIPADEVIDSMKRVGDKMSKSLKETAEGGLAATETARRLQRQVFGGTLD